MKQRLASVLVLTLAVCLLAPLAASGVPVPSGRLVVVVLVPYVTWEDVVSGSMPVVEGLARDGAVGVLSVRSDLRSPAGVTPIPAALALSAGAPAVADASALAAFGADEPVGSTDAAEAYRRVMGRGLSGARIAYLGLPMVTRANADSPVETRLGSLGQAVEDAGGSTGAVGGSDLGVAADSARRLRPAAIAAMDGAGLVRYGDVSSDLLVRRGDAPFGVMTDPEAFKRAFARTVYAVDAHGGPGLIVVDPGDLTRAVLWEPQALPEVAAGRRQDALRSTDETVRGLLEVLPDTTMLIIAAVSAPIDEAGSAGLAPIVVRARGWRGLLTSSSTHRAGLTTLFDVSVTALSLLEVQRPVGMLGNPMLSDGGRTSLSTRVEVLERMTRSALAIDSAKPAVLNTFIAVTALALLLGTAFLLRVHRMRERAAARAVSASRSMLLFLTGVPLASLVMFAPVPRPGSPAVAVALLVAVSVAIWAAASLLGRERGMLAVAWVGLVTAASILFDQWRGAPWSFTSFFGYSPLLGARYYGLGNESAGIIVGSSIVGLALLFDHHRGRPWVPFARRWLLPAVGAVVVLTASAPPFGANIGVAVWGTAAFVVAWAQMNGHPLRWRAVAAVLLAAGVLVAVFSFSDRAALDGTQTHLGRAWASAERGGIGQLKLIAERKAATNVRVLTRTNWSYLLIVTLAFLGYLRWRPQGDLAATLRENPYFAAAMSACLIGGVVAYFTEDSGIVVPALIMLYVGVGLLCLTLSAARAERDAS